MECFLAVLTLFLNFHLFISASLIEELSAYNYGFDAVASFKRQYPQRIVVSRLPSVNGTVPIRNEIRQMKRDTRKWNLYILALSMMQNTDQDQDLSWYQITGIHGVPFQAWGGVPPVDGGHGGYCPHMSILFPTWHRPYLALYEQILFYLVQKIASWYPDPLERSLYETAAASFRTPYWDWARTPDEGSSAYLDDFMSRGVYVDGPNGRQFIANPLFSYRFRPLDPGVFEWGDFPHWTETKRAPESNVSHNEGVRLVIDRIQPNLRDRVYNLLTNYPEFGPFSNKQWSEASTTSGYDSLESLHDEIHIEVGYGGHLYFIQYSAFDPIFFLHHTMIDRLLSLWQVLYPETWVTEQLVTTTSFTISNGTLVNKSTPLAPFFADDNGTFWDSESSRYTEAFGYSYAEVSGMNGVSEPRKRRSDRARLAAVINQLYGSPGVTTMLIHKKRTAQETIEQGLLRTLLRRALEISRGATQGLMPHRREKIKDEMTLGKAGPSYTEWIANIRVESGTLDTSFSIGLFLGPPPRDTGGWRIASNLVGTMGVFSMSHMATPNKVSGTIPLTSTLLKQMGQQGLHALDVERALRYLKQSLQFRVFNSGGEIPPASVPGLCIEVVSSRVNGAAHIWELPHWNLAKSRFIMFC